MQRLLTLLGSWIVITNLLMISKHFTIFFIIILEKLTNQEIPLEEIGFISIFYFYIFTRIFIKKIVT